MTQHGKRQPVNLTIKDGETPGLTWGTDLNTRAFFSDIRNVSFVEDNGKFTIFVNFLYSIQEKYDFVKAATFL